MANLDEPRHRKVRIAARVLCPIVLIVTFVSMEFALAAEGTLSGFISALRWFIFTTLFAPFLLGALMGHWYHPVPIWFDILNKRFYKQKQIIPPLILVALGGMIAAAAGSTYGVERLAPSYLSFIMVVVGVVLGAIVWPVRVLRPHP